MAEDNEYNQIVSVGLIKKLIDKPVISIAENGLEVLKKLKAKNYDIILMDLHMPEMDGYEASKTIRATFSGAKKDIPIIALTASIVKSDIERCVANGMNGYLSKPFTPKQLLDEINKHFKSSNGTSLNGTEREVIKAKKPANRIIDTAYLENITDGNTAEIIEYIDIFLKFAPVQIKKLEEAVKANDKKALYTTLHTIKPQLQFMGVSNALHKTRDLEIEVKEKGILNAATKKEITAINHEISEAMKEWSLIKQKLNT